MVLKRGITGFYNFKEEIILNDSYQFKLICIKFIEKNRGQLIEFNLSQLEKNFYYAKCLVNDKHLYILLNAYYPFIAFASSVGYGSIKFIDINIPVYPLETKYQILNISKLSKQYDIEDLKSLSKIEIEQINYWKPVTVGEIIFNYWD